MNAGKDDPEFGSAKKRSDRNPYEGQKESSEIRRFAREMGYQTTQRGWDNYKSASEIKDMMAKASTDLSNFANQTFNEKAANSGGGGSSFSDLPVPSVQNQTQPTPPKTSEPAQKYPTAAGPIGGGGGGQVITVDICVNGVPKLLDIYASGSPY